MNMKKLAIAVLSASILTSSAFASGNVVATYSGNKVTEKEVMDQFSPMLEMQGNKGKSLAELDPNLQEALVTNYVKMKLLEQEAKKSDIESSKEFQQRLASIKNQMVQQELIEKYLSANVNEKMIDEAYDKLKLELKDKKEVKVSHILVETEEKAKEIKKKLSKGSKFDVLAKEFSKDEGSKVTGGEIGYIMEGQLVPEFEKKALSMKVNEISDPVKTQFGWHIIKVLDKRAAKIPSKEEALDSLSAKVNKDVMEKYFAKLAKDANVEYTLPKK